MKVSFLIVAMLGVYLHAQAALPTCMLTQGLELKAGKRRLQSVVNYCPNRPSGMNKCNVTATQLKTLHDEWQKDRTNLGSYLNATGRLLNLLTKWQEGTHLDSNWQNNTACKGKNVKGLIGSRRRRRLQVVIPPCNAAKEIKASVDWQKARGVLNNAKANAERCKKALETYKAGFLCSGSTWMPLTMANNQTKKANVCAKEQDELWGKECEGWLFDMGSLNYLLNGWYKVYWGREDNKRIYFVPYFRDLKTCGKDVTQNKRARRLQSIVQVPSVAKYASCRNVAEAMNFNAVTGSVTYGAKFKGYFQFLASKIGNEFSKKEVEEIFKDVSFDRAGFPTSSDKVKQDKRRLQTPVAQNWSAVVQTDMKGVCIDTSKFKPNSVEHLT